MTEIIPVSRGKVGSCFWSANGRVGVQALATDSISTSRGEKTTEKILWVCGFCVRENKLRRRSMMEFMAAIVLLAMAVIFHPGLAGAQSLEPRAYSNTPVGMNFLILGYAYQKGDVLLDPSVPLKDVKVEVNSAVLAYVRSLDVWGKSGKIDVIVPYAWLSGSGTLEATEDTRRREVSGFADPALRFSVNLYGAPSLSLEEFKSYRQDTILGVSLLVTMPLGQYDSDKLANIGTNRWSFKPEVGISQALGRWTFEAAAGVTLYTKNDDFFGGKIREQDPIYSLQGHLIYNFPRGIWGALDVTYYTGRRKPEPELDRLSNILKAFNDQFGNIPWTDADRVHKLITEDIPARVSADKAYQNAKQYSDKQNARIEHDKALGRVMTAVLKDDTELFKQFSDNEGFRRWLTDTVFGLTYDRPEAAELTSQ